VIDRGPRSRRHTVLLRRGLALASALAVLTGPHGQRGASAGIHPPPPERVVRATVIRVVDGDTIRVRLPEGVRPVRLIGVDAPEVRDSPKLDREARRSHRSKGAIQAMGRLAAGFAARHLLGRTVSLEFDIERRDRYGRLLAYVWLPDGVLFNGEVVREGYAQVLTIPPNVRYASLLRQLQREARAARRGLWGKGLAGSVRTRRSRT